MAEEIMNDEFCSRCGSGLDQRPLTGDPNRTYHCESTLLGDRFVQAPRCRVNQLEAAIKLVCTQKADDKCWMDLKPLANLVGVELDMHVGDPEAMLKNCDRYVRNVCVSGGPWKTYATLEEQVKDLSVALTLLLRDAEAVALPVKLDTIRSLLRPVTIPIFAAQGLPNCESLSTPPSSVPGVTSSGPGQVLVLPLLPPD